MNVAKEVSAMERLTVDQLRAKYADVFREATRSRHKASLIKRIAWRMQANVEGGLAETGRQRAVELADESQVRAAPARVTCRIQVPAGRRPQRASTGKFPKRVGP